MEIEIKIIKDDLEGISWLDMRFNPLANDEDIWIPVRDRTAKITKITKLA